MAEDNSLDRAERITWALKLFAKSPLKQRKFAMITQYLGDLEGRCCLDIGSDNGVISLLLRRKGGLWYSADLTEETVTSITELVGDRVVRIDDQKLPFEDDFFDLVIIVDFLEHIANDRGFVEELYRVIKPDGQLILNVPNPHPGWLRQIRFWLGQTDQAHGHLRPGYTPEVLEALVSPQFSVRNYEPYSRTFAELVDTSITAILAILRKKQGGQKGTVITGQDLNKLKKSFKLYNLIYPLVMFCIWLDQIFWFLPANMLIMDSRKNK